MQTNKPAGDGPLDCAVGRPVPGRTDWMTPTTYLQRFGDAVAMLCNSRRAPEHLLQTWLDGSSDELQEFVVDNAGAPWAQGIVILDAAALLANSPTEGVAHGDRLKTPNVAGNRLARQGQSG